MAVVTAPKITLEPVVSSSIRAYGYDRARRTLAVQFTNATVFHYTDVDLELATSFYCAQSKGAFYANEIKGKFRAGRMTGPCRNCSVEGWLGELCDNCEQGRHVIVDRRLEEPAE